jgi:alpha-amylase
MPIPDIPELTPVAVSDPGSTLPAGWQYGGMYEVFVRAYHDSNGDGFGDLQGLILRLDYLKALGVSGLWLMPVMQSQDHDHGYAITNYRDVESQYGSLADLDALIAAAHARGMGVILDYVMNHSAAQHPAFLDAKSSRDSRFRDWYLWRDHKPDGWNIYGNDPWHADASGWYFGAFWDQMPDWNLRNPAVIAWHHDNLRFWLNRGVDGFRFDAVGNLIENDADDFQDQPESYGIVAGLRQVLDAYENRFMVCESPADPIGFAETRPGVSAFAFGHHRDMISAATGDARALELVAGFPPVAPPWISTVLSNHDAFAGKRPMDQLGYNSAMMKLAAAMYLLQPGVPFIYYGEEIGMSGGANMSADDSLRTPMSWTDDNGNPGFTSGIAFRTPSSNLRWNNHSTQRADPDSIFNFYKAMLTLRRSRPSLARGEYDSVVVSGPAFAFRRLLDGEETLVAINISSDPLTVTLTGLSATAAYASLWITPGNDLRVENGGAITFSMVPQSVSVYGRTE